MYFQIVISTLNNDILLYFQMDGDDQGLQDGPQPVGDGGGHERRTGQEGAEEGSAMHPLQSGCGDVPERPQEAVVERLQTKIYSAEERQRCLEKVCALSCQQRM